MPSGPVRPQPAAAMTIIVTNQQGQPLEGVVIMVTGGPVSVPDIASLTDGQGRGSLGHLTTPGRYTLLLTDGQRQASRTVEFSPGGSVTVRL